MSDKKRNTSALDWKALMEADEERLLVRIDFVTITA
jgi:hypothetical protein